MQIKELKVSFALRIFIIIIFGNLFLGTAFQNISIYRFPINEILLLFFLVFTKFLPSLIKINRITNIIPFLIWMLYGGTYIFFSYLDKGIWALRDGSHNIDSLYLLVGFIVLPNKKSFEFFIKTIGFSFFLALFYILLFPFQALLISLTPKIVSAAGHSISFFFNFFALKVTWCWLGFYNYILFYRQKKINLFYSLTPVLLIGASLLFGQSRALYFALMAILIFLMIADKASKQIFLYVILFMFSFYFVTLLGLEIKGRISYASFDFFIDHMISAIPGVTLLNPEVTGPAGSVNLRLFFWTQIIERSLTSVKIFLFGQGFGLPLTEFAGGALSVVAREPHNMYISIFARLGIVGLLTWIWMHITFFIAWRKSYKYAVANNLYEKYILLFLLIYILFALFSSIGGSVLMYPCFTIPYYFFWGVILRICFNLQIMQNEKNQ